MPEPKLPKERRPFDPNDPDPCRGCSNCCEYISLEIDRPTTFKEYDEIMWYLIHKDVWVYIDDEKDWYIQFNTKCEKLDGKRCGYYPHRPQICREYEPEHCVYYGEGEPEEHLFKNEEDFFKWMQKHRPKMFKKLADRNNLPVSDFANV